MRRDFFVKHNLSCGPVRQLFWALFTKNNLRCGLVWLLWQLILLFWLLTIFFSGCSSGFGGCSTGFDFVGGDCSWSASGLDKPIFSIWALIFLQFLMQTRTYSGALLRSSPCGLRPCWAWNLSTNACTTFLDFLNKSSNFSGSCFFIFSVWQTNDGWICYFVFDNSKICAPISQFPAVHLSMSKDPTNLRLIFFYSKATNRAILQYFDR